MDQFRKYSSLSNWKWIAIVWIAHILAFIIGVWSVGSLMGGLVGIIMLWSLTVPYAAFVLLWNPGIKNKEKK